jgi:8-oxo-dGTP diphosphatase
VAEGDGNGCVLCRCGHRHWGLHGAAGLLLASRTTLRTDGGRRASSDADWHVLLQLRALWTHHGGTWGLPGGAVDSHEGPVLGALREAHEETTLPPDAVQVLGTVLTTDHGDWTYQAVLGVPLRRVAPRAATAESDDVRWVPLDDVSALPLHPGFAGSWPDLRSRLLSRLQSLHPC